MSDQFAVIGDVHGCIKTLELLYDKIKEIGKIYCVGDLVDRGPASRDVIRFVKEHNIITTLGNHESLAINACARPDSEEYDLWYSQGGNETKISYQSESEFEKDIDWMKGMDLFFTEGEHLICHAGVKQGLTLEQACDFIYSDDLDEIVSSIIWCRNIIRLEGHTQICGHTPVRNVVKEEGYYNIDTGCVYGGSLTAIIVPEMEIISIPKAD
ncbi:metallophosphoesterase family protein [Spirochaetota bacterium]